MSWRDRLLHNSFGSMAAIAGIVLGTLGLVFGDGVSQGMHNSLHATANVVAHLWGGVFAAGGVLKLLGTFRVRTVLEVPGLWLLCGGYGFYAITVVVGLGTHGIAAGVISGAMTVGCLLKTQLIMRQVWWLNRSNEQP